MRLLRRQKQAQWSPGESAVATGRSNQPDLAGRRRFLAEHMLLHTHIPKTAGSALSQGLMAIVGGVRSMDLRVDRRVELADMTAEDLADLSFLAGHFAYGEHPDFGRKTLYFASVREPVARAVSNYRFLQTHTDHPGHPIVKGKDFEAAWEALARAKRPGFHNAQSRMLTATPREQKPDPVHLRDQLEQAYFLVIPQPEMKRAIHKLRAAFGVPWARVVPVNASRGFETEVSAEMRARILAADAVDDDLYRRAEARFDEALTRACDYIASRCLMPLKGAETETGTAR